MMLLESDIIHCEVLGTHIIVLNSTKAAKDLLEKRSNIYSDRCAVAHGLTSYLIWYTGRRLSW